MKVNRRNLLKSSAVVGALGLLESNPALSYSLRDPVGQVDLSSALAAATQQGNWKVTAPIKAKRFELIGLDLPNNHKAKLELRARGTNGGWSRWVGLHFCNHSPNAASPHTISDPIWTDASTAFQIRFNGSPKDATANLIHSVPMATASMIAHRLGAGKFGRLTKSSPISNTEPVEVEDLDNEAGAVNYRAKGNMPTILPRASWGSFATPPRATPELGQVSLAFVHHTAGLNDYGPAQTPAIVANIAKYHILTNRWNDIAYNFLIDKYGQIYEGRGGGITNPVIGAQAQGFNHCSTGISFIGNYDDISASPAAIEAAAHLLGWKLSLHGCPTIGKVTVQAKGGSQCRFRSGTSVTLDRISAHRDGDHTDCPGKMLYRQLDEIRRRSEKYAKAFKASSMTLAANELNIKGALAITFTATLAGTTAKPQQIYLEQMRDNTNRWNRIDVTKTDPSGKAIFKTILPCSGKIRAITANPINGSKASSNELFATVRPELKFTSKTPRRVPAGTLFIVQGTVSPAPTDAKLAPRIVFIPSKGRPLAYGSAVKKSIFTQQLRLPKPGLYKLRISSGPEAIERRFRVLKPKRRKRRFPRVRRRK